MDGNQPVAPWSDAGGRVMADLLVHWLGVCLIIRERESAKKPTAKSVNYESNNSEQTRDNNPVAATEPNRL